MKYKSSRVKQILGSSQHLKKVISESQYQDKILNTIRQLLQPQLAAHCISVHYSEQSLKLFTDSSVWSSKLRFQSKKLLKDLNQNGLPTHKIDVRVIPASSKPGPKQKKQAANQISSQTAKSVHQVAESINDNKLSEALKRLAKSAAKTLPG